MTVKAGTCGCGEPVERSIVAGRFSGLLHSLPLVCDRCTGETDKAEQAELERRGRRKRADRRIERSGLPDTLHDVTLDVDQQAAVGSWPDPPGLVLVGPVGTGKTYAAAGAAWGALEDRPVRWTSAPLLFARLGSGLGTAQREEALEILTGTTALVLDDLDKARPTEYGAEQVFLAVDGRVTAGAPLLVTTNLTVAELARKFPDPFGEAVASRLAGYCAVRRLGGPDRRTA